MPTATKSMSSLISYAKCNNCIMMVHSLTVLLYHDLVWSNNMKCSYTNGIMEMPHGMAVGVN